VAEEVATARPAARARAAYDRRYGEFVRLYRSLKDDFARIAELEG
jgi:hypothetical protein